MCPSEDRLTSARDPPFTGAFRVRPFDEARAWLAADDQGSVCGSLTTRAAQATLKREGVGREQLSASQARFSGTLSLRASLLLLWA